MGVKEDVVDEMHRPARINFKRRHVIVKGLNDLYQADLVEMIPFWKSNKGFRYILMVINVFSKYLWAIPVKRKTAEDVTKAMESILIQSVPTNLQTDDGKEFKNRSFEALMKKYNINHYSTFSTTKASIVERVNRTLKSMMWKQFTFQRNNKWLDLLPQLVSRYNNTVHSTIGYKPKDVTKKNEKRILRKFIYRKIKMPAKFKVGDKVRISKNREVFTKGYTPNWSNEIFSIKKVHYTNPTTYLLEDSHGEDIRGGFYTEELQKVKHPDAYLVDKILKKKGKEVYVKFTGIKEKGWLLKKNAV